MQVLNSVSFYSETFEPYGSERGLYLETPGSIQCPQSCLPKTDLDLCRLLLCERRPDRPYVWPPEAGVLYLLVYNIQAPGMIVWIGQ